ncbi:MAG: hypothetical protein ACX93N_10940 [Pseudohaliea sp.]
MTERTQALDTRGSRPAFFSSPDLDAMMTALLETMSQLWATRDYARALEKLLVEKGVLGEGELDAMDWTAEENLRNHAAREAFFADAFRAIGADFQGARQRTAEIDEHASGAGE